MNDTPLVTVNILSFNRKDELRNTLTKVYEQDYKNIEVIVVDNASSDGSREMVEKEFPDVQLIKLGKNIGIAGWNEGFKVAKGEYILVLDDDSYPSKKTITEGINVFGKCSSAGIIAFNIYNLRFDFSETKDFKFNPLSFNGCGALIKINVVNSIGYYSELLFIYLNELDYSARCYNNGYDVIYLEDIIVYHNQSLNSRSIKIRNPFASDYRYYHFFKGMLFFIIQYFDLRYALLYTIKWILNRLIICVRFGFYKESILAIRDIMTSIPQINRKHVLKYEIQKFYNFGNFFPLIDRDFFPEFRKTNDR